MSLWSLRRLLRGPIELIFGKIAPVAYARSIGVNIEGALTIYGSSYGMFSTEPFLVTLGDNVYISVGAKFICHDGGVLALRRHDPTLDLAAPIRVGANTFIGAAAVILKGVTIGEDCIVGASAVVTKDVAAGQIVAGNPARVVSSTAEFLEKAQRQSLGIGHLTGAVKEAAYKRAFHLDAQR